MRRAVLGHRPYKQRSVGLLLHRRHRQSAITPLAFGRGAGGEAYIRHHPWQQFPVAVLHVDSHLVCVRERIRLYTFFYSAAIDLLMCSLHTDGRGCRCRDAADLSLRNAHLHLHAADVEDSHYGLRGHRRLAGTHQLLADDTANRGSESAVSEVLLGYFILRLGLSHLALNLYPLHFRQRTVVVQHLIAFQGIVGLVHLRLGTTKQVTGLCVVHLGYQLTFGHGLSLVHQHALHHTHARKTDCRCLALLQDAYERLSIDH